MIVPKRGRFKGTGKKIKQCVTKGTVKVPVIMQLEATECGAASLAMVMAYFEKWLPLEQTRQDCAVSRDGSNARNILRAARSYGMDAHGFQVDLKSLKEEGPFPCIVHWGFNHFVVLDGFKGDKAYLNDPARGFVKVSMDGFDKNYTGIIITVEPGPDFEPSGRKKFVLAFAKQRLSGTAVASHVSVADYYAFNTSYAYVTTAFAAMAGIAQTPAAIRPILEIIEPLLKAAPEIAEDKEVVTRLSGRIELNRVSFKYPGSDQVILDDVSLKIRPGQYVAVVGKTGCGKSTLMRLLLGFEKPSKGAIYYDGKDLERLDKKAVRRKIGVVLQNGKLIQGDIFSNITISAPWLGMDDAWAAAEIAGIAEDIREMPMGMQTIIQEGSGGISGGQRQRIMIARAVAPKPKILFLDEATSALDNITQKHVSEAMDAMKCTRIVIAHRLSTIRQCDRILVLDQGKIIEDGSYEQLIARNGFFAELVERQRVDV